MSGILLVGALCCCIVLLANADAIAARLGVIDHPNTDRKQHGRPMPLIGGIAIIVSVLLWIVMTIAFNADVIGLQLHFLQAVALCGGGTALVGYADDQSPISPVSRLIALALFAIAALVICAPLRPTALVWESFGTWPMPLWFACTFVAVALAGYVNAVNMADGQDGIVGGMMAIWAICLMIVTNGVVAQLAAVLFVTVSAFVIFNLLGRTFIGDSGTYGVGFVFGLLAIMAHNQFGVKAEAITVWFFIPIADCLRLGITRAAHGISPSLGDRDHFHHRLQDKVGKTGGLCAYLGAVGLSSVIASVAPHLSLMCLILLATFYLSFAWLSSEPQEADLAEDEVFDNVVTLGTKNKSGSRKVS